MSFLFVDADVIIPHLRGHAPAKRWIKAAIDNQTHSLCIGAMQRAEILFFTFPERIDDTIALLTRFKTEAVTEEVIDLAGAFYRRFHAEYGTGVNDAILAAHVVRARGRLATRNRRHFPMDGLKFQTTW